jgi:hypothetical protein
MVIRVIVDIQAILGILVILGLLVKDKQDILVTLATVVLLVIVDRQVTQDTVDLQVIQV